MDRQQLKHQFYSMIDDNIGFSLEEAEASDTLDRMVNLAEAAFAVPDGLIEVRGSLEKTVIPRGKEIVLSVSVINTPGNMQAIGEIGQDDGLVAVRGLQGQLIDTDNGENPDQAHLNLGEANEQGEDT